MISSFDTKCPCVNVGGRSNLPVTHMVAKGMVKVIINLLQPHGQNLFILKS